MNRIKTLLLSTVGRLYKMGLLRDILLIVFCLGYAFLAPYYGNLIQNLGLGNSLLFMFSDPIYLLVIASPIAFLFFMLWGVHQLDRHFRDKDNESYQQLITRLDMLTDAVTKLSSSITSNNIYKDKDKKSG